MRDRPVTPRDVTARRNPFELWIVVTCVLTGIFALLPLGGPRTGVVDRYLPIAALPWYIGLLVGGCITLIGTLWRSRTLGTLVRALSFERVGLVLLTGLLLGYGGALLVTAPRTPVSLLMIGLAVAAVARVRQIVNELKTIQHIVHTAHRDDDATSID